PLHRDTLGRRTLRGEAVRMGFALQVLPALIDAGKVLRELLGYAEELEIGRLEVHTRKDSPQPQRSRSLGLLNLKPSFSPSRTKSSSVPSRYARLFGSISTRTPFDSNAWSSGWISSANSSLYARPEQPVVRTPRRRPTP